MNKGAYAPAEELPELPGTWRWTRLGELVDQTRGICYGIVQPGRHDPNGVPMVNSQDITDGKVAAHIEFRVTQELHARYRRSAIRGGEILLTLVGANFGQVAVAPSELAGSNCSRAVGVLPVVPESGNFVALCLRSRLLRRYMDNWANTTAQPTFNLKDVANLPIPMPPKDEADAITHVLKTLDDKIEINRRINETLEAMALALFRSWFVHFDPVRARAGGIDSGLPEKLADLFPNRFEESEIGDIPKGWSARGLDDIATFLNGLALQKYPPQEESSLPVIKIAQLRTGSTKGADRASGVIDPAYVVHDGDVLFSWSGSLECALWGGGAGALNQHLFKVTSTQYPKWLYYFGVREHLDVFRAIAAGKATTMGHIQRHHLSEAKIAVPPPALLDKVTSIMEPMIESLWRRKVQSRTLAALRDTLLPRLISGELRVKDAEKIAARAL